MKKTTILHIFYTVKVRKKRDRLMGDCKFICKANTIYLLVNASQKLDVIWQTFWWNWPSSVVEFASKCFEIFFFFHFFISHICGVKMQIYFHYYFSNFCSIFLFFVLRLSKKELCVLDNKYLYDLRKKNLFCPNNIFHSWQNSFYHIYKNVNNILAHL